MDLKKKIVISLISFWGVGIILALVFAGILVLQRNLTISKVQASPGPECKVSDDLHVTGSLTVDGKIYGWNVPSATVTTATHNGAFGAAFDGYPKMNIWIQTNGCSGYHVCDASELTRWAQSGGAFLSGDCWYNTGVLDSNDGRNDCLQWTAGASGNKGSLWSIGHVIYRSSCDKNWPVCCCK